MSAPSAQAGPSRPTPIRSLRHPALLSVATRNDAGGLEPPSQSDAVALRAAMQRKVDWRRKGERWMDKFCEDTVGREEFKRGAKYLEHHQYLETLHERHLNSLCSYPLCPKPPSAPYTSKPRFSISAAKKAITSKEGNEDEGFCSRVCRVRSGYVGGQLEVGTGVRGAGWVLELLEEAEEKRNCTKVPESGQESSDDIQTVKRKSGVETVSIGNLSNADAARTSTLQREAQSNGSGSHTSPDQLRRNIEASTALPTATGRNGGSAVTDNEPKLNANHNIEMNRPTVRSGMRRPPPSRAAPAPPPPPEAKTQLDALLANLQIYERPTSSLLASPSASNQLTPLASDPALNSSSTQATSIRAGSSLIATPSKLANTLITASRGIGPVPQLADDSDSDSELSDWEVEMDAFRGLGEEERRLFEEMREAREMMGS